MSDVSAEVRKRVLNRDNSRCRRCGREDNLTLHHIGKKSLHAGEEGLHEEDNLVTLCWMPCHALIENHEVYLYVINGRFYFTK